MRHLFVCTNLRGSGKPVCAGTPILVEVQRLLLERHASAAMVTACDCLGPCFDGPNAVIYPDATWYGDLSTEDAPRLVEHLIDGTILDDKRRDPPGSVGE